MNRFFLISAAILLAAAGVAQSQIIFTATLDGAQEVPAVSTPAGGTAVVSLNVRERVAAYLITYAGLQGQYSAAHFHYGAKGIAGKVAYPIDMGTPSQPSVFGTIENLPDSVIEKLIHGEIYINIHSTVHPTGEIRGQLIAAVKPTWVGLLNGANSVPAVLTDGVGTAWATFDAATGKVHYRATVNGLSSDLTDAHFHYGRTGENGPVALPLNFINGTTDAEQTIPDSALAKMTRNGIYMNIHTTDNPGGEIRSQMTLGTLLYAAAELRGDNEVPPVQTDAKGVAIALYNHEGDSLVCFYVYDALKGDFTAAHIHYAAEGQNGKVVMPLGFSGVQAEMRNVPDSVVAGLLRGRLYANVHSSEHTSGEIRGQLGFAPIMFFSILTGANEVPPVITAAAGVGLGSYLPESRSFRYMVLAAGLADITAAHIHRGLPGIAGPVLHEIALTKSLASGVWNVPQASFTDLIRTRTYFNVHSTQHPSGEIRGQILLYGQEVDTPTGVAEEFGAQLPSARLRVSPNPAGAGAMLEITPQTGATGAVRVRVYDAAMREAARYDATISGAETLALPLDASALPAGAYIICAGGSGWSAAVPFAVER